MTCLLMENVSWLIPSSGWFAVRCVFRYGWPLPAPDQTGHDHEERITIWRARSAKKAIGKAEAEAEAYASTIDEAPSEFLGLSQSYELFDNPDAEGAEVFSLLRRSVLEPDEYLKAFFDTGDERIAKSLEIPPA